MAFEKRHFALGLGSLTQVREELSLT
jgi:hypothetical protein